MKYCSLKKHSANICQNNWYCRKANTEINRVTLTRLCPENCDFGEFPKRISEDCKPGKVKSQHDEV